MRGLGSELLLHLTCNVRHNKSRLAMFFESLPAGTSEMELREIFGSGGNLLPLKIPQIVKSLGYKGV